MEQNLLDPARESVCGDYYGPRLGAYIALVAPPNCFRARSFYHGLLLATALLSFFVSPGTGNPRVDSLSASRDGVRDLIDLGC